MHTSGLDPVEAVVQERYGKGARVPEADLCCPTDYDPRYLDAIPDEILEPDAARRGRERSLIHG